MVANTALNPANPLRAELPPEVFTFSSTTQELLRRSYFTFDEPLVTEPEGEQPQVAQDFTATAQADVLPSPNESEAELVCAEPIPEVISDLVGEPVQPISIDTIAEPVVSAEPGAAIPVEGPVLVCAEMDIVPAEPLPAEILKEPLQVAESLVETPAVEVPVVESAMPWPITSFVINAAEQTLQSDDLIAEAAGPTEESKAPSVIVSTEESLPAEAMLEAPLPVVPVLNLCSIATVGVGSSTKGEETTASQAPGSPSNLDDFFAHYAALAERELEKRSVSEVQEATEAFLSAVTRRGVASWIDDSSSSPGQG